MDINWEYLIDRRISVLIKGKEDKIENYNGYIMLVDDDYIFLGFPEVFKGSENYRLDYIMFKKDLIISMWIYKKDKITKAIKRDAKKLDKPS